MFIWSRTFFREGKSLEHQSIHQDTPLSCEPTLLPEPNHVMINHLYALSIKDGVMVLSATNRYRKKYVTTLLYKPMGQRPQQTATKAASE